MEEGCGIEQRVNDVPTRNHLPVAVLGLLSSSLLTLARISCRLSVIGRERVVVGPNVEGSSRLPAAAYRDADHPFDAEKLLINDGGVHFAVSNEFKTGDDLTQRVRQSQPAIGRTKGLLKHCLVQDVDVEARGGRLDRRSLDVLDGGVPIREGCAP